MIHPRRFSKIKKRVRGSGDGLTKRQREIVTFIRRFAERRGFPPTVREIARFFGFRSPGTVQGHLSLLQKKNALRFLSAPDGVGEADEEDRRVARGLALVGGGGGIPLLGQVPAGSPTEAIAQTEDYVDLGEMFKGPGVFALHVKGESMTEAGILDRDTVLVKSQPQANVGEIVVALVDGEATVKRWTRQRGKYWLSPAHPAFKPIPVTPEVRVAGVVLGVVRRYRP